MLSALRGRGEGTPVGKEKMLTGKL